jgi:uncharacterized protein YwqG
VSVLLYLLLIFAFGLLVLYRRRPHLFTELRDELAAVWDDAKAEMDARRADKEAGEPLSETEADEIIAWYRDQARPALLLRPDAEADASTAPVRLGGKIWFADGEEWPLGPDGGRLEFVAQYDLSRLPALEGFPRQGVARFFIGRNDIWGVNLDIPDQSNICVLWHDGPQSGGRCEVPLPWGKDENSPFESVSVRADGLALWTELIDDRPDYYSWQLQEQIDRQAGRLGLDVIEDELMEINETREFAHRIGGHPSFTQYDFRKRGENDDLDIVLLGLSSDKSIMWGDVGEAAFYIRREDLERRNFSRVAFYWDCH